MTDEELEALLDELEEALREDVQAALTLTAQDFAFAVRQSTELTAASFSVSRIGNMWRRRVGGIVTRLRAIAQRGARTAAEDLGEPVPTAPELAPVLDPYLAATRSLLEAVGDRLAAEATQSLAEGQAAGETTAQLKQRMLDVFTSDGAQLGPTRAQRIAATEATRAFNAGTLAAAQSLTGPERPLVKQWITRNDEKVRRAHRDTNGQLQFLDDPFDVDGTPMQYPGDPTAPADLTINCRCIMRAEAAPAPAETTASADENDFQSRMPGQLKRYWLTGPGAAKIGWGTPGSFERCVRELRDDFPQNPEGLCANLYHEATGRWPGQDKSGAEVHTGAMIALLPSAADAERLAVVGGEAADQLHMTLYYLGEAADWPEEDRTAVREAMRHASGWLAPLYANLFGVAQWNPASDSPAWVWNVGDDRDADRFPRVGDVHHEVTYALEDRPQGALVPSQYTPWSPHVCALYGEVGDTADLVDRLGPITFDRLRVAFGGEYTDFPLLEAVQAYGPEDGLIDYDEAEEKVNADFTELPFVTWSTPGTTALAFENQQTGDGRVFAPGALYWDGSGPWPLQYADEMIGGHDGARLAGSIETISRDGGRIPGTGRLYLTESAGWEAARLLAQGAPLGVSVDLDGVDIEMVDASPEGRAEAYKARLLTASVMATEDGGWFITGETEATLTASQDGRGKVGEATRISFHLGPDCTVPRAAFELDAAAGDPDIADGLVVEEQRTGDFLMRITRGRVRGATLVTIPAFADARIVLDPSWIAATAVAPESHLSAAAATSDYDRVVRHVRKSYTPVDAAAAAKFLGIAIVAVRRHLARAVRKGELVRLSRGKYVAPTEAAVASADGATDLGDTLVASVTGTVDLPVASRETQWDGDEAKDRVFEWADGDTAKIARAFAYRDDEADPLTKGAYKLGYADVLDGGLTIVPSGVSAALGAMNGARGGVDIPSGEKEAVRAKLEAVAAHVAEETGEDDMDDMQASAWAALAQLPSMPAEWFREPTAEELPPGGPGVNYANGRIFGWVAQAGEAHAGFAKKITIDGLGRIDTTHFLRQRFTLDDGSVVKAGAYTMNVGHHRDGAECETSACQFDDTRTVAGIVTVGMNERGMWFSGAAAPWLSEWDRQVFQATQPSYHMKKGPAGNWQLRAVLSVPVPGHSSPLLASAVVERSQVALTAAATMAEVDQAIAAADVALTAAEPVATVGVIAPELDYDRLADAIVAASARADQKRAEDEAELAALLAEAAKLADDGTATEGN